MTVEMFMEDLIWKNGLTSSRVIETAAKVLLENIQKKKKKMLRHDLQQPQDLEVEKFEILNHVQLF